MGPQKIGALWPHILHTCRLVPELYYLRVSLAKPLFFRTEKVSLVSRKIKSERFLARGAEQHPYSEPKNVDFKFCR
jgi:hypothetical protein